MSTHGNPAFSELTRLKPKSAFGQSAEQTAAFYVPWLKFSSACRRSMGSSLPRVVVPCPVTREITRKVTRKVTRKARSRRCSRRDPRGRARSWASLAPAGLSPSSRADRPFGEHQDSVVHIHHLWWLPIQPKSNSV